MELYGVVIVGAGHDGLKCAESPGGTGLKVLLPEKNDHIWQKTCADGLTVLDRFILSAFDGFQISRNISSDYSLS